MLLALTLRLALCVPIFADNVESTPSSDVETISSQMPGGIEYTGDLFEGTTLIKTEVIEGETTYTTAKTHVRENGLLLIDELTISKIVPITSSGYAHAVTRTVRSPGIASVTLIADFDWYTNDNGFGAYVRCSRAVVSTTKEAGVTQKTLVVSKDSDYVYLGKAEAHVEFDFTVPKDAFRGGFSIWCSDSGAISDSGDVPA